MYSKKTTISFTVLFVLLMVTFSFTDLAISRSLFNIESSFGKFFEAVGELPAPIVGVLSFCILFFTIESTGFKGVLFKSLTFIMILLSGFMASFMPLHYVMDNFMGLAFGLMIIICGSVMILTKKVKQLSAQRKEAFRRVAIVGASLFVLAIAVINIIKPLWGRVRFREMYEPYDMFSTWMIPQVGKYRQLFEDPASFPSGHTGNSVVIIMIILLPILFERFRGKEWIFNSIAIIWITLVALSRIVMGAHFASDVTIGAALIFYCFIILCKLCRVKDLKSTKVSSETNSANTNTTALSK